MIKLFYVLTIFCIFLFDSDVRSEQKISVVIQHEFLFWPNRTDNNSSLQWQNRIAEKSINEDLRMKVFDEPRMLKTLPEPVYLKDSVDSNINITQLDENAGWFEKRAEKQALKVAPNIELDKNIREFEDFSKKQALIIDTTIKKYLLKKKIQVVESQGEVIIKIKTHPLIFDSLNGYYFDSVEYEAIQNGEKIFSGFFNQKARSQGLSQYFLSSKYSKDIGIYLAKDILAQMSKVELKKR